MCCHEILSLIWTLFKFVAREDVIIRACLICGIHSWSLSLIWASFLKRFPFWTSLFKFFAYLDVNLDACPTWTSLFERVSYVDFILEVCRLFGRHSWSVFHFGCHSSSFRIFGHHSWSVSRHKIERGRLTNIVRGGIYHIFASILVFVCVFDANDCEGWKDVSYYSVGVHLFTVVEWALKHWCGSQISVNRSGDYSI